MKTAQLSHIFLKANRAELLKADGPDQIFQMTVGPNPFFSALVLTLTPASAYSESVRAVVTLKITSTLMLNLQLK